MKQTVKRNNDKIILVLFIVSIAVLIAMLSYKLAISAELVGYLMTILCATCAILFVMIILRFCSAYTILIKEKNIVRQSKILKNEVIKAENNYKKFIKRAKIKCFLYSSKVFFFIAVCIVSFCSASLILFTKYFSASIACLLFSTILLGKAIKKGKNTEEQTFCDITNEEFPLTFDFFNAQIEKFYNKKIKVSIDLDSCFLLKIVKNGNGITLKLNTYCFFLLTQEEISAVLLRELLALENQEYRQTEKVLQLRAILTKELHPTGFCYAVLFSTLRQLEIIKDKIFVDYCQKNQQSSILGNYMTAYKKQSVFDAYLSDPRSFIYLSFYKNGEDFKRFNQFIFSHFLDVYPTYAEVWNRQVENELKVFESKKLTYSEKVQIIKYEPINITYEDNTTPEMKCIYEELGAMCYETTKNFFEMRKVGFEESDREIMRYEQNPSEYNERLKLISLCHAYYTMGRIDKTEEVYQELLSKDNTSESIFDYGGFLLTVKRDSRGVDYIYKAMDNENLVDEGLFILEKYFIISGDREGYDKFYNFKQEQMKEIVKGVQDRVLDENKSFTEITLEQSVVDEIIQKLSIDDNLSKIYCANGKTKSGRTIFVFGISVRNKSERAFFETYERVFSILDNEYGNYDTFLLAVDSDKKRKSVKNIIKDDKFLRFKR